ncbi:hypothetical protein [Thermoproteus tenax]|uniref:DNA-directed RNA polymerase, subunit RPB8 n=1 Tax=Thermoproteus tenax (strain ATCC 35583 / DSM 2078 / JCM 9277 / NBRC 100435 / Kra 1) TaxID=768679 RepID=G4RLV0_THETK|nr:hypothetical protein [Thermoproteus tenax]CCC82545.1 DNA-directed RNA polymerase, subunit RPB8 [Thermoproteus tenax Kra 1]
MEFNEVVSEVSVVEDPIYKITMTGDAEIELELPLRMLNIDVERGKRLKIDLDEKKNSDYKKIYDIYLWGIVYNVDNNSTYISIGGLLLKIKKSLPLSPGVRLYIGIKLSS